MRSVFALPSDKFNPLLTVSGFLLQGMGESDSTDDILDDIDSLKLLNEEQIQRIRKLVEGLVAVWKTDFGFVQKIYSEQHSVIRVPSAVSSVTDLRAVIHNEFRIGDELDKYDPKIQKLVPVSIMRLRFDDQEEIVFQLDQRTLRILVAEFGAAEKEMDNLIAFVGNEKVHPGRRDDE